MPRYVVLVNFTDQGIRTIRDFPEAMQAATQRLQAAGVSITRYFTMGQYDAVVLIEAPSDEVQLTQALNIGSQGNLRTTTLKAFTEEEFVRAIGNLPRP